MPRDGKVYRRLDPPTQKNQESALQTCMPIGQSRLFQDELTCTHVEARGLCYVSSLIIVFLKLWDVVSQKLESTRLDCLANKLQGEACLWLPSLGLQTPATSPDFLRGYWRLKPQFSYVYSKPFSDGATSSF